MVRIFASRTQPDHLKRFFALFGTGFSFPKNPVPALAQETHFLVQNFSELKILTKFDGFWLRESGVKRLRAGLEPSRARKLGELRHHEVGQVLEVGYELPAGDQREVHRVAVALDSDV